MKLKVAVVGVSVSLVLVTGCGATSADSSAPDPSMSQPVAATPEQGAVPEAPVSDSASADTFTARQCAEIWEQLGAYEQEQLGPTLSGFQSLCQAPGMKDLMCANAPGAPECD